MPFGFGAKRSHAFLIFAPFNPGKYPIKRFCPERARDGAGEMPFECYRKGIGHFLGRRYNLPLANNTHRHKVERWRGPIEICFSRLLLITMIWRPFRARRPGGRFPGLKPWAEWREDKECMGSFRPETEGHENLAQG